jgi:hypothetical protein
VVPDLYRSHPSAGRWAAHGTQPSRGRRAECRAEQRRRQHAPAGAGADLYNAGSATLIDSLLFFIDGNGSLVVRHY